MTNTRRCALVALLLATVLALGGCATARPFRLIYVPSGAAISDIQAHRLASTTDISALASVTTTDAPALRDTVLRDLRTRGALGQRAADLLTQGFPARTAAVPALVRFCTVDGVSAVVVVEAFGDAHGTLTHRRLWIFDRSTGAIIGAASFR